MSDATDTWLGRAIRDAAADAARTRRRVPTVDELEDDRRERFADTQPENEDDE